MGVLVDFPNSHEGTLMAGDAHTRNVFNWLDKILGDDTLPPAAFKVAYFIAQSINRSSGLAWPSCRTIADAIGFKRESRGGVLKLLKALRLRGYLEIIPGNVHQSNRYRIILVADHPQGVVNDPQGVVNDPQGVVNDPQGGLRGSHKREPLKEPLSEPLSEDARAGARTREVEIYRWEQQNYSSNGGHSYGRPSGRQGYISPGELARIRNVERVDRFADRLIAEIEEREARSRSCEIHVPPISKSAKP
jgi:hypothetical protein